MAVRDFVDQYGALASSIGERIGVSPNILLGQWGLETGWGKSVIPGTNNLGNIKSFDGSGVAATDNMTGSNDNYRQYGDSAAFGDDFASLLERRYKGAIGVGSDAESYAKALKSGGYAEDPAYVKKLITAANMARDAGASDDGRMTGKGNGFDDYFVDSPRGAPKAPRAAISTDGFSNDYFLPETPSAPVSKAGLMSDTGNLLKSGVNQVASGLREAVRQIPVVGDSLVSGADAVDKFVTGKTSDEILKGDNERIQGALSDKMRGALDKKWWNSETQSLGDAWTDPRAYAGGIIQSLPGTLLTMIPAGRLAKMAYEAKVATLGAEEAAKAAARTAMLAGGAGEGLLSAGQTAGDIREELAKLPQSVWDSSDAYKSLIASGMDDASAKAALTNDAATKGFLIAGVTTAMFGGQGDRVLALAMRGGVSGGIGKRIVKGVIGEGFLEEAPQSYTQEIAKNVGVQTVDPTRQTTEGAFNAALGGLAVGAVQGGGMNALLGRSAPGRTAKDAETLSEAATLPVTPVVTPEEIAAIPQAPAELSPREQRQQAVADKLYPLPAQRETASTAERQLEAINAINPLPEQRDGAIGVRQTPFTDAEIAAGVERAQAPARAIEEAYRLNEREQQDAAFQQAQQPQGATPLAFNDAAATPVIAQSSATPTAAAGGNAVPQVTLRSDGQPFATLKAAETSIKARGLSGAVAVSVKGGGFGIRMAAPASTPINVGQANESVNQRIASPVRDDGVQGNIAPTPNAPTQPQPSAQGNGTPTVAGNAMAAGLRGGSGTNLADAGKPQGDGASLKPTATLAQAIRKFGGLPEKFARDLTGENAQNANKMAGYRGLFHASGTDLSTLVHDGKLDAYLPPSLRSDVRDDSRPTDTDEAVAYIEAILRNGEAQTAKSYARTEAKQQRVTAAAQKQQVVAPVQRGDTQAAADAISEAEYEHYKQTGEPGFGWMPARIDAIEAVAALSDDDLAIAALVDFTKETKDASPVQEIAGRDSQAQEAPARRSETDNRAREEAPPAAEVADHPFHAVVKALDAASEAVRSAIPQPEQLPNQGKLPAEFKAAIKATPGFVGYFVDVDNSGTMSKARDTLDDKPLGSYIIVRTGTGKHYAYVSTKVDRFGSATDAQETRRATSPEQLAEYITEIHNATNDAARPQLDLTNPTESKLRADDAKQKRDAAEKAAKENAPSPEEFGLVGSNRAADVGAAAGQEPIFSRNKPTLDSVQAAWNARGIDGYLSERNDVITVHKIIVPKNERGNGIGTAAMQELIRYADSSNQQIALTPSGDFGGNKKRLNTFYRNLGFRTYKGFAFRETLVRDPQGNDAAFSRADTIEVDGQQRPRNNSNGKPIAATDEGIRNFWRWFAGSRVVDDQGRPLVVYHGTAKDFSKFDENFLYSGEGASQTGSGFYFTDNPESASGYSGQKDGSVVMPIYLSLQNPLSIDFALGEMQGADLKLTKALTRNVIMQAPNIRNVEESPLLNFGDIAYEGFNKVLQEAIDMYVGGNNIAALRNDFFGNDNAAWLTAFAKATGYDSAKTVTGIGDRHFVAWKPNQVKSALGNTGQFSPDNADIRFSREAPLWRSTLTEAIGKTSFAQAPADQWKAWLNANAAKLGVKKDEIEWSGVTDWLALQKGKVTRDQVREFLDENGVKVTETMLGGSDYESFVTRMMQKYGDEWATQLTDAEREQKFEAFEAGGSGDRTKYGSYQLPGGENYRELLLTLPTRDQAATDADAETRRIREEGGRAYRGEMNKSDFKSSHWDQPNILAHIRFNERTDADGKKVLFIEEIQSDWGQAGKKQGFQNGTTTLPDGWTVFKDEKNGYYVINDRKTQVGAYGSTEAEAIKNALGDTGVGLVPRAPFVGKTEAWVSLALKRMIRYAVDNGFDRIAMVNGEQSAERYDLSKQVDSIEYRKHSRNEGYQISGIKDGTDVIRKSYLSEKDLEGMVGKDVAAKIINGEGRPVKQGYTSLSGVDLKVGGEGMKAFYDRIVPQVANDVLKKLGGGKVELRNFFYKPGEFGVKSVKTGKIVDGLVISAADAEMLDPAFYSAFPLNRAPVDMTPDPKEFLVQPSFDITDKMREHAAQGMPLFRRDEQQPTATNTYAADVIVKAAKTVNIPLDVYATPQEASAKLGIDIPSDVRGLHYRGRAALISSNITTPAMGEFVLWHELLHAGITQVAPRYGNEYNRIMQDMAARNSNIIKAARDWRTSYGAETVKRSMEAGLSQEQAEKRMRLMAIEEAIADLAGANVELKGWQQFVAKLQALLRSMGFDNLANWIEGKSNAEVLQLIARTRDEVTTQNLHLTTQVPAFARDEDDASYQRAYHGTPHKFDKFSLDKIGTGEGAQAYGYGLYFASKREIAEHYRNALGRPDSAGLSRAQDLAAWAYSMQSPYAGDAMEHLNDEIARMERHGKFNDKVIRSDYEEAKRIVASGEVISNGKLYQVDIPEDSEMLHWDKPLSEQSDEVKALANKYDYPLSRTGGDFQKWASSASGGLTINIRGPKDRAGLEKQASDLFKKNGIRGIKYLDGASRTAGDGSYNYVVFDDKDVNIEAVHSRATNDGMANDKTVVGNTTENPADGDLKGSSPSRLVDTEGMTREQARDAIQSRAESLASTLREHGFDVGLQHSGSIAGASSYLSVYDPQTGRFIKDQIRVSGHSKGAFNSLTVHSVATDEQAQEIVDVALAMRARGPTEKMLNDQVRAREHDAKILARAQRRSANGQLLTRSEQAALDGSNNTGRSADDVNSGATAASQMLDVIERDPYADYAIRVIPGEFTGSIRIGDTLPASNKWEDGTDTGEPLSGTSGIGIEQRTIKGVEQAIHRIGSSKTAGPNGFYFGNRVVLIKGESIASGEDIGERIIQNAEVVGVWTKPTKGKSEIQPNKQTTSQDGDVAFSRTGNGDIFDKNATDAQSTYNGTEAVQGMGMSVKNVMRQTANIARDKRGAALSFLGGRQIADIYSKDVPELPKYNEILQRMQAEQNEGSAVADSIIEKWRVINRKRPDVATQLSSLMHDSTLAQVDPDVSADNAELRKRWINLPQEAKDIYREARDAYVAHFEKVKAELIDRVERSALDTSAKNRTLASMREEFTKAMKGVYFPLARFGDYMVVVKDKAGVTQSVSMAETTNQAQALRAELLRAYPDYIVGAIQKKKEFNAERDGVSRGFMKDLVALISEEPDAQTRDSQLDAINQLWLSSLPDLSWAKSGIHRKGTPGYSNDAMRAFARNMFHGGYHLAKLRYGDRLGDTLAQMQETIDNKVRSNPEYSNVVAQSVVDEMNARHKHVMNPQNTPVANALTGLGFMWHMGLSPASAVVNLSQTALVAYPMLASKFGFGKAATMLLSLSADAVKGKNDLLSQLQGAEKDAYDRAVREGLIDVTMAHDLAGVSQGKSGEFNEKQQRVMRVASVMFHEAEKFNRGVTFMSAYRLAVQSGVSDPYKLAHDLTFDSHFDYSSQNRPRVMQGPTARVILLFKQYGQNMIYTLSRNTFKALQGDREAQKTLAGLLAMHGMFAGALGLPLMTTLLAAASAIGGSDDEPWDAQVALRNYLADAFGKDIGEVLAHGVFRAPGIKDAIGADISGRVGLDSMLIRMPQETLEGKKYYQALLETIAGPVFGIGGNIANGMQTMAQGNTLRGIEEMLPKSIKDPLKAYRYEQDGIQDKTGITIVDETTIPEEVAQFLGFSPARGMEGFEGKSAIKNQETLLTQRRRQLMQRYGKDAEEGDTADSLTAIQRWNIANPTMAIKGQDLLSSMREKAKRQAEAENGAYLSKKRRGLAELGEFANAE